MTITITDIGLFIFLLSGAYFLIKLSGHFKNLLDLKKAQFDYSKERDLIITPLNQDTLQLLDMIVNLRWQDTLANNIDSLEEGAYINKSLEAEFRKELTDRVKQSLTPFIYSKLLLVYDAEKINDIISEKIISVITIFKLEKNTTMIDK